MKHMLRVPMLWDCMLPKVGENSMGLYTIQHALDHNNTVGLHDAVRAV